MRIKKTLSAIVRTLLLILFGILVFIVTSLLLSDKSSGGNVNAESRMIQEKDSCYIVFSKEMKKLFDGKSVFLYAETEPCAACSERAIMSVVYPILDSCSVEHLVMVYHPIEEISIKEINEYHLRFKKYLDVVVSREDSIMTMNPWMPKYLGFYGIITDSINRVLYAGSLFDKRFLESCYREFKKI